MTSVHVVLEPSLRLSTPPAPHRAATCRIAVRQPSLDVYDAPCGSVLVTSLAPGTPIEYGAYKNSTNGRVVFVRDIVPNGTFCMESQFCGNLGWFWVRRLAVQ